MVFAHEGRGPLNSRTFPSSHHHTACQPPGSRKIHPTLCPESMTALIIALDPPGLGNRYTCLPSHTSAAEPPPLRLPPPTVNPQLVRPKATEPNSHEGWNRAVGVVLPGLHTTAVWY